MILQEVSNLNSFILFMVIKSSTFSQPCILARETKIREIFQHLKNTYHMPLLLPIICPSPFIMCPLLPHHFFHKPSRLVNQSSGGSNGRVRGHPLPSLGPKKRNFYEKGEIFGGQCSRKIFQQNLEPRPLWTNFGSATEPKQCPDCPGLATGVIYLHLRPTFDLNSQ